MKIVGTFLEYENEFVIVLRHAHKPNGNTWGLPAGKIEPDESPDSAALRELFEETGYQAAPDELEHLGDFDFGANSPYTFATYCVRLDTAFNIQLEGTAHSEYRWVTPDECYALTNLVPDFHELLKVTGLVK